MTTTKSSHRPPDKRLGNSQTTNLLRATARYFHHILIIGAIRKIVRGGGGEWGLETVRTTWIAHAQLTFVGLIWNVSPTFVFFIIIIILMTKVLTKKKSTSTKEFAITYFFNKFIMSLITSFYKETYELSVINTKKFLCSGVPQSPR